MDLFTRKCPHNRILRRFEHCERCLAFERQEAKRRAGPQSHVAVFRDITGAIERKFGDAADAAWRERTRQLLELRQCMEAARPGGAVATSILDTPSRELFAPTDPKSFFAWFVVRDDAGLRFSARAAPGGAWRRLSVVCDPSTLSFALVQAAWADLRAKHASQQVAFDPNGYRPDPSLGFYTWSVQRDDANGRLIFSAAYGYGPPYVSTLEEAPTPALVAEMWLHIRAKLGADAVRGGYEAARRERMRSVLLGSKVGALIAQDWDQSDFRPPFPCDHWRVVHEATSTLLCVARRGDRECVARLLVKRGFSAFEPATLTEAWRGIERKVALTVSIGLSIGEHVHSTTGDVMALNSTTGDVMALNSTTGDVMALM